MKIKLSFLNDSLAISQYFFLIFQLKFQILNFSFSIILWSVAAELIGLFIILNALLESLYLCSVVVFHSFFLPVEQLFLSFEFFFVQLFGSGSFVLDHFI